MSQPLNKRKPPGGGSGRLSIDVEFAGYDIPKVPHRTRRKQAMSHRRDTFARAAMFLEFGYRSGRAIDYDGFVDRQPNQSSATTWWRAAP